MEIEILPDADSVARRGAAIVAAEARAAVAARGKFIVAVSGGGTPWRMLRALAGEEVPWEGVHVVQVDERVAPAGHPDRNLTRLRESLLAHAPLRPERIHAMPVESSDLDAAAEAAMIAKQTLAVDASRARQNLRLVEHLEDLDDVQRVTSNLELTDEILAEVAG